MTKQLGRNLHNNLIDVATGTRNIGEIGGNFFKLENRGLLDQNGLTEAGKAYVQMYPNKL